MNKTLLVILTSKRNKSAAAIQNVLTEYGCLIKTRLGIHDGVLDHCSNTGLIILELVGDKSEHEKLSDKINSFEETVARLVCLSL